MRNFIEKPIVHVVLHHVKDYIMSMLLCTFQMQSEEPKMC